MRSATTGPVPVRLPTLLQGGVLALALTLAGVLLAGPALAEPTATPEPSPTASSAIVDPARPTARLVHGPNCTDGFVRVEVTNGTAEHAVTLTYDGVATGATATLGVGEQVVLEGDELAPGTRAEVGVAVTGVDGPEDPLDLGDWTRPSQEDCDAVTGPTGTPSPTTGSPTTAPPSTGTPTTSSGATGGPTTRPTPTTTSPTPAHHPVDLAPADQRGPRHADLHRRVGVPVGCGADGGRFLLDRAGVPGQRADHPRHRVRPRRGGHRDAGRQHRPLATVTADDEGRVEAVVQIPQDVVLGPAVVRLVGVDSASATEVALEVAARDTPGPAGARRGR